MSPQIWTKWFATIFYFKILCHQLVVIKIVIFSDKMCIIMWYFLVIIYLFKWIYFYQDCGHAQTQTPVAWQGCWSWRGSCGPCWPGAGARLTSAPRPPGPSTARPGTEATTTPPASGAAAASAAHRARSRGESYRIWESGDYKSVMMVMIRVGLLQAWCSLSSWKQPWWTCIVYVHCCTSNLWHGHVLA